MKKCFASLAGLLAVLILAQTGHADTLDPGTSIANDSLVAAAGGGTLKADTGLLSYTVKDGLGNTVGTGTVREIVVSGDTNNPLGGLVFIYQVKDTTGAVGKVSMTSYATWGTNASAVDSSTQNSNNPPGTSAWLPSTSHGSLFGTTPIARTSLGADNGATVSFNYNDGVFGPGDVSQVMIVRTNATTFSAGSISVIDGGTADMIGYAPGPEPSSFVLMGLTGLSFSGMGIRRWFRKARGA